MRLFISRRLGRNWRAGASFDPRELAQRRRGPARALASVTHDRPVARSYYGLSLDQPDPSADPPHEPQSIGRSLWQIVSSLAYLAIVAIVVAAFVAIVGTA